jgi:hypothetical protein
VSKKRSKPVMIQKLSGAKSVWILLRRVNSVKEEKQAGHDTEAV